MAKGSNFEREISKNLSLWWTDGERDDIFWRTSQSGGRATIRKRKGKTTANQDGDICAIDPIGQPLINKTTIELKVGYNGWTIKEIVEGKHKKPTVLEKFFEQCEREADAQNKNCWWLITRQDRRETLLFMNHEFWKWLIMRVGGLRGINFLNMSHSKFGWIHCMRFSDFTALVDPEIFNEKCENGNC